MTLVFGTAGFAWRCGINNLVSIPFAASPLNTRKPQPPDGGAKPGKQPSQRLLVVGSTGYIGKAVVRALVNRGHGVVAFARPRSGVGGTEDEEATRQSLAGADVRFGQVTQLDSLLVDGGRGESFHAVVCCLASRSGGVADSWRIDHQATVNAIEAARRLGARQFVLLSAICVQKPLLAFQKAKCKAEEELKASGLVWSIVRPTAFFKSLAAQVEPVRRGCPYVMFGDGQQAACTPISEEDLAEYMADCLERPELQNRVLPIGGPGPALTARQQGELLFSLLQRPPRFLSVPVALFDVVIRVFTALNRLIPGLEDTLEYARIGRYYATESMLTWDPQTNAYCADATPSTGTDTLEDFYKRILSEGLHGQDLGDQLLWNRWRKSQP